MWSKDYLEYDDFGILKVKCMRCNTPVATRALAKVEGREVMAMRRLPNWRQVRIELNNGTYAEPIVCVDCAPYLDDEKALEQIKKGWVSELRGSGKSEASIKIHSDRVKSLAIKKKLAQEKGVK